jgi:hypothetical protein
VSEIRFYADEHVAKAVTAGPRLRLLDVLTVQEAGLAGAEDEAQVALRSNNAG